MNSSHLRVFATLAEAGNLHEAAKLLFLTPPAVKYALDKLEAETGLVLFDRTHAGLELTESGRVFADYASRALALLNEGVSMAANASPTERQRIDAPWTSLPLRDVVFFRAYPAFREAHPDIDVELRRVDSLVGEHYDVINGFADVLRTHAVPHPLAVLPLCCVVASGHPLADRGSVKLEELGAYELLVPIQELVDQMDEQTRSFLGSRPALERIGQTYAFDELYPWCVRNQRVALAIGEWPRIDGNNHLVCVPVEDGCFQNNIFTQEHPSAAVKTYVAFMQAFYADALASA